MDAQNKNKFLSNPRRALIQMPRCFSPLGSKDSPNVDRRVNLGKNAPLIKITAPLNMSNNSNNLNQFTKFPLTMTDRNRSVFNEQDQDPLKDEDFSSSMNNPFDSMANAKHSRKSTIKNKYLVRNWESKMAYKSLPEPRRRGHSKNVSIKEIRTVQVPFRYSFYAGTPDSVDFLKSFAECKTEEFVTSDWKEVVKYKWQKYKPFHIILALLYWTFTVVVTTAIVFYPNVKALQRLSIVLAFFFLVYEIFELVSYCCFDIWSYFGDPWNTADWGTFFGVLIYFFGFHHEPMRPTSKLLSTLSLMVLFYRSFSYLRIINSFTTLVRMINIIISKLVVFFLILAYFYVATTFLLLNLDTKMLNKNSFTYTYALTMFGAIANDHFFKFRFAALGIIFGTLSVTILLMNILVAFLSNAFSRLEEQQHVNGLKEKASMILDMEVLIRFFKYYIPGAVRRFYFDESRRRKNLFELKHETLENSLFSKAYLRRLHPQIRDLRGKREFLYIFKSVDYQEKETQEDIDQNIYKRVKVLGKSVVNLQTMVGALYEDRFGSDHQEHKKYLSRLKKSKM